MKKLVPKGTSSYQATWIVDSDGEGEDVDDSDSEGEPDEEDDSEEESMGQEDMVSWLLSLTCSVFPLWEYVSSSDPVYSNYK